MISRIVFKKAFGWGADRHIFEKDLVIEFSPGINVLVGDQGSGKSTLIELIRTRLEPDKGMSDRLNKTLARKDVEAVVDIEGGEGVRLLAFDFEKDAARGSSAFDWGGPIDTAVFLMQGNRASHGEANRMAFNMLFNELSKEYKENGKVSPTVVLLDEPDAALSIASITVLHLALRNLAHLGCQVIVSAHNPFLLGCFPKVFFLEYKKWVPYGYYLTMQMMNSKHSAAGKLFIDSYRDVNQVLRDLQVERETPVSKSVNEEAPQVSAKPKRKKKKAAVSKKSRKKQ